MNSENSFPEKIELRKKFPPTYGRKKSRSLTAGQQKLLTDYYPQNMVTPDGEVLAKFNAEAAGKKVLLEIGFGNGEHLVHLAREEKDAMVIGCEVFINSFVVGLKLAKDAGVKNLRFYNNDSRYLLEAMQENSIDKVYILFPDPWPKKKQFKRRIISKATLDMLHGRLRKGGVIRVATDIDSYFEQMLEVFANDKRYEMLTDMADIAKLPQGHIITHYNQKALDEGRLPRFLEYRKV